MSWVYSKSKFPKDGSIEALYLFLNPKNIVSIYKGSTKINLLLVYHFYTKITKKKYRKSSQVQEYYTSWCVLFWRQRQCRWRRLRALDVKRVSEHIIYAWEWRTADIELTLGFDYSRYRRHRYAFQQKTIIRPSAVSPPVLLRISQVLKTQFLGLPLRLCTSLSPSFPFHSSA